MKSNIISVSRSKNFVFGLQIGSEGMELGIFFVIVAISWRKRKR